MTWRTNAAAVLLAGVLLAGGTALSEEQAPKSRPRHKTPAAPAGAMVVTLCDGETSTVVEGAKEGEPLPPEKAQTVADGLMSEWRRKHPEAKWDEAPREKNSILLAQNAPAQKPATPQTSPRSPSQIPPAQTQPSNAPMAAGQSAQSGGKEAVGERTNTQQGHTYGAFGSRDELVWKASVDQFIEDGNRAFHDAKRLGGTTGVSCDMCHPNAANTHPETYPKYQVQLGRVALLRDMINWCIENPVRGKPLADDDPTLKALEAFILAQRKGVPLEYGKH